MKKIYGGYEIAKTMGHPLTDYMKITCFLSLVEAPKELCPGAPGKGIMAYALTEKQIIYLQEMLAKIRGGLCK